MNQYIKLFSIIYGILNCIILCGMDYSEILKDENIAEMRTANYTIVGIQVFKELSLMQFVERKYVNKTTIPLKLYEEVIVKNNEFDLLIQISKEKMGKAGVRITSDLIGEHDKKFLAVEISFNTETLSEFENSIKENQDSFPYKESVKNMMGIYSIKNITSVSINNKKLFTEPKRFNKDDYVALKLIKAWEIFKCFHKQIKLIYIIQVFAGTLSVQELISDLNSIDIEERQSFSAMQSEFQKVLANWNQLDESEKQDFIASIIDFANQRTIFDI